MDTAGLGQAGLRPHFGMRPAPIHPGHFNNPEFIRLVRDGWIGSQNKATDVITNLVRGYLTCFHRKALGVFKTNR
jgi:hypothetical protein